MRKIVVPKIAHEINFGLVDFFNVFHSNFLILLSLGSVEIGSVVTNKHVIHRNNYNVNNVNEANVIVIHFFD